MTQKFMDELVEARVYCNICTPLFSYIMYKCEFVLSDSEPTAYARVLPHGNEIGFNPNFWDKLTPKNRAFLILHETLHIFLGHGSRLVDMQYDHEIWNEACDYHINYVLCGYYKDNNKIQVNTRYTEYLEFIKDGLLDVRFVGMSSDEIYHILLNEPNTQSKGKPYDNVIGDTTDTAEQQLCNTQSSIAAIHNADGSVGDNELGVKRMFEELATHKVKWQDVLAETITSSKKIRETYTKYSKRSRNRIIFPSYTGNTVNLVLGVDTSGSVSVEQLNMFVSEIKGIMTTFDTYTVDIVTCDAKVYEIGKFDEATTFEGIDWSKLSGGGGTRMRKIAEYAQQQLLATNPDNMICVIFTDGYLYGDDIDSSVFDGELIVCINGNKKITFDAGITKILLG